MPDLSPLLTPEALARTAPGLTLSRLADLCDPPMQRTHMSRIANGRVEATATTERRVREALERAAREGVRPKVREGRPRVTART